MRDTTESEVDLLRRDIDELRNSRLALETALAEEVSGRHEDETRANEALVQFQRQQADKTSRTKQRHMAELSHMRRTIEMEGQRAGEARAEARAAIQRAARAETRAMYAVEAQESFAKAATKDNCTVNSLPTTLPPSPPTPHMSSSSSSLSGYVYGAGSAQAKLMDDGGNTKQLRARVHQLTETVSTLRADLALTTEALKEACAERDIVSANIESARGAFDLEGRLSDAELGRDRAEAAAAQMRIDAERAKNILIATVTQLRSRGEECEEGWPETSFREQSVPNPSKKVTIGAADVVGAADVGVGTAKEAQQRAHFSAQKAEHKGGPPVQTDMTITEKAYDTAQHQEKKKKRKKKKKDKKKDKEKYNNGCAMGTKTTPAITTTNSNTNVSTNGNSIYQSRVGSDEFGDTSNGNGSTTSSSNGGFHFVVTNEEGHERPAQASDYLVPPHN